MILTLAFFILGLEVIFGFCRREERIIRESPGKDLSKERAQALKMDGRTCPRCGATYYSTGPVCYACDELESSAKILGPGAGRKIALQLAGLVTAVSGFVVIRETLVLPLEEAQAWADNAFNGLVLISLGAMSVAYSILGQEVPLWKVRLGARPQNRKAAILASFGLAMFIYCFAYELLCDRLDAAPVPLIARLLVLALSMSMIASGSLRRPAFLFAEDVGKDMGISARIVTGLGAMFAGMLIVYGVAASGVNPALGVMIAIMGILISCGGFVHLLGPLSRPWMPGSP